VILPFRKDYFFHFKFSRSLWTFHEFHGALCLKKLKDIEVKYTDLESLLSDSDVISRQPLYQKYAREHAELHDLVETYREYEKIHALVEEGQTLLRENDEELKSIVKEEMPQLREQLKSLEDQLKILLLPRDPNDDRNVLLEIRAGTGGDEAGLFVGDLFRMYARYAEMCRWKVEVISSTPAGGMGGFKELLHSSPARAHTAN